MWILKDALVEAFSRLWNKLGFSWISALISAVNPIFFWMVFQILWILTGHGLTSGEEVAFFVVAWMTVSLTVHVFPTTFAALEYMRGVYEMDVAYLRHFFIDYWRALKRTWWRSLQLFAVFALGGIVVGYAVVFYGSVLVVPWVRMVFLGVLVWVYVALSLMQFVLLPMLLYNPAIKLFQAIRYSFRFVFVELVMVGVIALFDVVIFFLLSMGYGFALVTYYLFGLHFRLAVYKQLQKRYLQKSDVVTSESEVLSHAWKELLVSRKSKHQNDR